MIKPFLRRLFQQFLLPITGPAGRQIDYEQYQAWRKTVNMRPRTNLGKVGERLGEEFCKHFGIRDSQLSSTDNRTNAETRILTRYVKARYEVI